MKSANHLSKPIFIIVNLQNIGCKTKHKISIKGGKQKKIETNNELESEISKFTMK